MKRCLFSLWLLMISTNIAPAKSDWWSWQLLAPPRIPASEGETTIDRFISATLETKELTPSPQADQRTLIRRLYFDLIGLPPSMAEVDAFVKDDDPQAYAKLVNRLLESPHYGERWARHWLDVVHYGETHGYDKDKPRMNAWPYRDYVIRAFNEDKPYARFIEEQLAGDALYPETVDGIVATGFLAAGPWDFIGHAEVPEEKIDGKVARHLDRDDMVTTTLNAFCSLTVQCAQCHDHKRDPVTMKDYYSLQSIFAALDRADRKFDSDPDIAKQRAYLTSQLEKKQAILASIDKDIDAKKTDEIRQLEDEITKTENAHAASLGYHSQVASDQATEKWIQVDLGKSMRIDSIELFGAAEYGFKDFGFPHRFRVTTSSQADFLEAKTLVNHTGDIERPGSAAHTIELKRMEGRYVKVTATKLWNRRQKGQPLTNDWIFALGELVITSRGMRVPFRDITALDSIEAAPRWRKSNIMDGQITDQIAKRDALIKLAAPNLLAKRAQYKKIADDIRASLKALPKPKKVYVGKVHHGSGAFKGRGHLNGKPRPIHILHRGEVTMPRAKEVFPATVPGIVPSLPVTFNLPKDHLESDRRIALAEWITHPDNTLTWRSIVNRVWHYHFGRGLVETPNDFGRIGGKPTHPELLDWLAIKFRDEGGSIKNLHRWILNSQTYKQVSTHDAVKAAQDSSNQFLWRQNRRRLEAEAIRDSVLFVAGKLNTKMYGPSFMDFVIKKPEHSPHYEYHLADPHDSKTHRRSIYRFLVRSQPQPFMQTFDCADPSELVDKRGETNTALQALAMLNNKHIVAMATHFADRVKNNDNVAREAILLALSREITPEEHQSLTAYAQSHGITAMCRLIFNLSEFSFID
jgi:hypothetical protein